MLMSSRILYAEAGEGTTGAGGGSGLLTASAGGSTGSVPEGNAASGNTPSSASSTPGNNSSGSNQAGGQNNDWKSSLPKELQDEPSLKSINDINALAKSYISAQKLVGAEKIVIPSKHATEDDWKNVFNKLGLPADVKEYEVKFQDAVAGDKEFTEAFKQTAHQAGVLPRQAQALADWFSQETTKTQQGIEAKLKSAQDAEIESLRTEWGNAFDLKLSRANRVLDEVKDPTFTKFLKESGMENNTGLIKLLAAIGDKFYKESTEKGGFTPDNNMLSPMEAQKEYNKAMADLKHPYWVKDHPGHNDAVKEMARLFNMANPVKS